MHTSDNILNVFSKLFKGVIEMGMACVHSFAIVTSSHKLVTLANAQNNSSAVIAYISCSTCSHWRDRGSLKIDLG